MSNSPEFVDGDLNILPEHPVTPAADTARERFDDLGLLVIDGGRSSFGDTPPPPPGRDPGIGEVTPVGEPVMFGKTSTKNRVRQKETIKVDGQLYSITRSGPTPNTGFHKRAERYVFHFPGWLENADAPGSARDMHHNLALVHPNDWTITIANDGVNDHGHELSVKEALLRPQEGMASPRQRIMHHYAGESEVDMVCVSMDTALGLHIIDKNEDAPAERKVFIRGATFLSPGALASKVHPDEHFRSHKKSDRRISVERTARFLGTPALDLARTVRNYPPALFVLAKTALGLSPWHAPAYAGGVISLLPGTPWDVCKRAVKAVPAYMVIGDKDALYDSDQRRELEEKFDVSITVLEGEAHTWILDAARAARFAASHPARKRRN